MKNYKINLAFKKLEKALNALEAMAQEPMQTNRGNIDATIQRFEFTIELFWKCLRILLEEQGITAYSPKEVLKEAFAANLIKNEKEWLNMLKDRNLTSHTYDQDLADEIYEHIKNYCTTLRSNFDQLSKIYESLLSSKENSETI